jgi:predicted RNA-binding protein Jag
MLSKIIWKTIKLNVEINDYVKSKDDRLFDFIQKEISYLEKTWKDIQLPYFSSHERKKIHSIVHKLKNNMIFTKSVWEWKERRLYICKNSPKLTIDIDWNDI